MRFFLCLASMSKYSMVVLGQGRFPCIPRSNPVLALPPLSTVGGSRNAKKQGYNSMTTKRFQALTPTQVREHLSQYRPVLLLDEICHLDNINQADEVLEFVSTALMQGDDHINVSGAYCRGLSTILRMVQQSITEQLDDEAWNEPRTLYKEVEEGGEEGEEHRESVTPFADLLDEHDRKMDDEASDDDQDSDPVDN